MTSFDVLNTQSSALTEQKKSLFFPVIIHLSESIFDTRFDSEIDQRDEKTEVHYIVLRVTALIRFKFISDSSLYFCLFPWDAYACSLTMAQRRYRLPLAK